MTQIGVTAPETICGICGICEICGPDLFISG